MSTLQASVPHEGLAIKSISSLFLQCFTNHSCNAKESTSTILTVAHTQVISPKDSQGCQRLQQPGKQRKDPLIPQKLESLFFFYIPPGAQIRKCKAGDLCEGTASLCYRCAWDGAGRKSTLEFQVVPVQLLGTADLQGLFPFSGENLY